MAKLGLKSIVYHGVYYDGYIQPMYFNNYDANITTYDYLQMDFEYMRRVVSILLSNIQFYNKTI